MKKKIKLFALLLSCSFFAEAQTDLQNAGIFFITGTADTLSINGNFINTSSANFTNNGRFYLKQNFTNNQATMATGTGQLYLNGLAGQFIMTTLGSAFYDLTVNKPSGHVTDLSPINVNNILSLVEGKISLGSYNFSIGNAGSISGGSQTSYLISESSGSLFQQVNSNVAKIFPVGTSTYYMPATILLSVTSITDQFSVRVMDHLYKNATSGPIITNEAVDASWLITETISGGSDATVSLQWPSQLEMTGFNRSRSRLGDYNAGFWNYGLVDMNASGSDPYSVSRSGFTDFTVFSVSLLNALPVTWLKVDGKNTGRDNFIYWSTATESNTSHFVLEVSSNSVLFSEIGQINAAGNSSSVQEYNLTHYNVIGTINYYRIKQVDLNGRFSYSRIIKLTSPDPTTNSITLLLNPVVHKPLIAIQLDHNFSGNLYISDMMGRIVYKQRTILHSGKNIIEINSFNQPAGVYTITLSDENKLKLVKGFVLQ